MSKRIALFPILLLTVLFVAACWLTWVNFSVALPRSQWQQAIWSPDIDAIKQMVFHYSLLPRLAISLLVGAGLGLVGVLFQQVLRNPLAEPTTLGVATGAQLGITVTTLWAIPVRSPRNLLRWQVLVSLGRWCLASPGANVFLR